MKQLYVVTGAGGHLGNTVVKALLVRGEQVRVLAVPGDALDALDKEAIEIVYGDVRDKASIRPLFESNGEDLCVIHAAGIVSIASRYNKQVEQVNVEGTRNIVELCESYGVARLVYVSSVHAMPETGEVPYSEINSFHAEKVVGLYAQTKATATQIVLDAAARGLNAVVVHPSGIIGPYDYGHAHMTQMMIDYLEGRLSAGVKGGYDFVDVRDVANGIVLACDRGIKGQCYILSGEYMSVPDLFGEIHTASGRKELHTMLPLWFAMLTAPFAELYYKLLRQPPLFTRYSLHVLKSQARFSHAKATRELGYQPRSLQATVRDTVTWLIASGRVKRVKPQWMPRWKRAHASV